MFLLIIICTFKSFGQPVINQKEEKTLTSKITNTKYHLSVSLPPNYSTKDTSYYPVLYMLDGGYCFPAAYSARTAMDLAGNLEYVIIVAIEYDWEKSYTPWMTNRSRDFTPTKDTVFDNTTWYINAFGLSEGALSTGGASNFLNVMKTEIIPYIEKKYKTTTDRGICGHSFGGLFATYCLFSEPKLFKRYGINSPSYWWDNKIMFDIEKKFSKQNQSLPAQIFMSVGSLEGRMTQQMTEFADTLKSRNYKDLHLTTHIFDDESHLSVVPAMIGRTIKVLYAAKKE